MKLKVAIVGCGAITEFRHAPEYFANPDVEIAAFCDPVLSRAQRLADLFGGQAFTAYEDALALGEVDAVSVCTSNSMHAEVTIKALRAGKHVLCEKPMAISLQESRQMIHAAQQCGRVLMIGHNQRLAPAHAKARDLLQSGALGRVLSFKTTFGHGGPEGWSKDKGANTWFFKKSAASLGALGDLGVHKADLIRWLIDDEIDEVYAVTGALHKTYENGQPIDVEDNAICVLKSRRGITGTLCASWTYYGDEDNSTVLYCEKGILKIYASAEHPLTVEWRGGEKEYIDAGAIQTNANQTSSGVIDAFVKAVVNHSAPPVTGEDGDEALSIALACSQSGKMGQPIPVSHYRDGEIALHLPKKAQAVLSVQNLQMETNLIPINQAGKSNRYCDDSYPDIAAHSGAKRKIDGTWQTKMCLELGRRIN
jgi:UDP-N-acetylglucosamine 3-dehydrogenase